MTHAISAVKQLLRASDETNSVEPLRRAYDMLQPETTSSATAPSELYILCCESAVAHGEWGIAERCLRNLRDGRTATKVLEARALYCDALVALHDIPSGCRGKAKVKAHLWCATKIVTGIKVVLEEWPKEANTLAVGVEHLWTAIRDLFNPGTYESVVDTIVFVVALHDKLGLGGPFSHLQWIMRYAMCLRGIGRYQEAATQMSAASEIVTKVGSERLQLQFFRVQIALSGNIPGTRPKQDYSRPLMQALYAVQAYFCAITDVSTSKAELILAHDRLIADPERREARGKGKKNAEADVSFSDPALIIDVLSEVVLGLALCGAEDTCRMSLPKLLQGESVRPRLFGEYAQAILNARACGALNAAKALDASYLTRKMADALFQCIKNVEGTMDSARMIDDSCERSYTLEVGCTILWNLCLPLLQPETRGKLRHTLKRIALFLSQYSSGMKALRVRVAYESSLVEFEEDNLNTAIEQLDKALSLDHFVVKENGGVVFPMDFALLWLKRRGEVRKVVDGSVLPSQEDQAIHFIEQARTAASASNRLVLLQSALNKLPPLGSEMDPALEPVVLEKKKSQKIRSLMRTGKTKKGHPVSDVVEELPPKPRIITNPVAANIYHLLLKEAKEVKNAAGTPIIKTVASALTTIDVLDETNEKDLLVIKADAHLSMAEVLATGEKSYQSANAKTASITDAMMHISSAAKIGVRLCAAGYREEWIVINACLSLINWCVEPFKKGHFLPAAGALGELYLALNQTHVDPVREFKLFIDVGFAYVMSFIQSYIALKGEVNGELGCETLAETLQKMYLYPVCEANNPILRQASDVCHEMLFKWQLPSCRKHFCFLETCIDRLLLRNQEYPIHPQDQVLMLLGRLNGPMTDVDKRALINKECMEFLRVDPSVELCGRLAAHSVRLPENERTTMELCRIAENLYKSGSLGWGTKYPAYYATGKDKGGHSSGAGAGAAAAGASSTGGNHSMNGTNPKPSEEDWYWYASILLFEAAILMNLCVGIVRTRRVELEKRILVTITNSALAASHGPLATQSLQITDAYHTFCGFAQSFDDASRHLLLPSLKMLLSPFMISKLRTALSRVGNVEGAPSTSTAAVSAVGAAGIIDRDAVCSMLTYMGESYLRGLAETGGYKDGIKTMNELLGILPPKYHKDFTSLEAEFRCQLGLPTTQVVQKVKGADAETEAAVWVAIAKNAATIKESSKSWIKALEVLAEKPQQRAVVLLSMAEWMTSRNAITTRDLSTLLLSALDAVEHFTEPFRHTPTLEQSQVNEPGDLNMRRVFTSSLTGRTQFLASSLLSSLVTNKTLRSTSAADIPSFRDVMTAIRILYMLFLIAPDTDSEGNRENEDERDESENLFWERNDEKEDTTHHHHGLKQSFASNKRACASVIVHYVSCLWNIVALRVQASVAETQPLASPPRPPALELPQECHGWLGFRADLSHVDVIRVTCADDTAHNTEELQAMLLDVCDFLVEEQDMESCAFLLLSWIEFAAYWRYGPSDARAVTVTRLVALKSFDAAARAGCGSRCGFIAPPAVDVAHWSALREALGAAAFSPPRERCEGAARATAPIALSFARGRGALHRCVLAAAAAHLAQGRAGDALRWAAAAAPCAKRAGDTAAAVRARLIALRVRALCGGAAGAADALAALAAGDAAAGPLALWADVHAARVEALLMCGRVGEAAALARDVATRLASPPLPPLPAAVPPVPPVPPIAAGTGAAGGVVLGVPVAKSAARDVAMAEARALRQKLLREWARRFAALAPGAAGPAAAAPAAPPGDAAAARAFAREACAALREMGGWRSRLAALRAAQAMRAVVDAESLRDATAEDVRALFAVLHEEHVEAVAITDAAYAALVANVPAAAYAGGVAAQPSAQSALDEVLVLRARNCLERAQLCDAIVLRFRALTMAQLRIPTTDAPVELEGAVLQFMRGPLDDDDSSSSRSRDKDHQNGNSKKNGDGDGAGELSSALAHFGIPASHADALGAAAEAMLCRAAGGGDGLTPLRAEASAAAALAEFARRLRALCRLAAATAPSGGSGGSGGPRDGEAESAALTGAWAAGAIAAPERAPGGRPHRGMAQTGGSMRSQRRGRSAAQPSPPPPSPPGGAARRAWGLSQSRLPALLAAAAAAALRCLDGRRAAQCYTALAHTYALGGETVSAATAVEFAHAAAAGAFVAELEAALAAAAPEGTTRRAADAMRAAAPFLFDTPAFDAARSALCASCGTQRRFDLARDWPTAPDAANALPPDCCTLTVARDGATAHFLVALRRPDGDAHIRRVEVDVAAVAQCGEELEAARRLAKSEAAAAPPLPAAPVSPQRKGAAAAQWSPTAATSPTKAATTMKTGTDESIAAAAAAAAEAAATSAVLIRAIVERVRLATQPLWADFADILAHLAPTCHLFLCLDPLLHALPLEQLGVFAPFLSVQRELSVMCVRQKLSQRAVKAAAGGVLLVVDPFGEHSASMQTLSGFADGRGKSAANEVVGAVREPSGALRLPSCAYLARAMTCPQFSGLLVDMCGAFTGAVAPAKIAAMSLEHVQAALITEATNTSSLRREQRHWASRTPEFLFFERQWVVALLLLAQGVQYFGLCGAPLAPVNADALSKRCMPLIAAGGRGLYEAVRNAPESMGESVFVFYGVPPVGKH